MPELPEVETIVLGLQSKLINQKILTVTTSNKIMRRPSTPNFIERIQNRIIKKVSRRAKYILISLDNSDIIIFHLGMSGRLFLSNKLISNQHNHCVFELSFHQFLIFYDPRRFGYYNIFTATNLATAKIFANLGLEPLSKEFTIDYLKKYCNHTKKPIKQVLMDNKIVVGIGNIYASESLFIAKILPFRAANTLTNQEINILVTSIITTLNKAINFGGSTLQDYRTSDGKAGSFQNHLLVYGRENQLCNCYKQIIQKIVINSRSTYFCAYCQK